LGSASNVVLELNKGDRVGGPDRIIGELMFVGTKADATVAKRRIVKDVRMLTDDDDNMI